MDSASPRLSAYVDLSGGTDCVVVDPCVSGDTVVCCGTCAGHEVSVRGWYANDYCDVRETACCVDYFNTGSTSDSPYMSGGGTDFDITCSTLGNCTPPA